MNCLIVHGAGGNPQENWFPWLKAELEKIRVGTFIPRFPTPKKQTLNEWMKVFSEFKDRIDEDAILVGHSLGVAFILNVLEKRKANAAFFVAGFGGKVENEYWEGMKSFADKKFDWGSIRKNCSGFFVYHSDNDQYIPLSVAEELAGNVKGKLKVIKGAGHFNTAAGYNKFGLLLEDMKRIISKHL